MKRMISGLLVALMAAVSVAPAARAAVNVERTSSENPVQEISKSVIYGGLAGLLMGSAIALANDGHDASKIIRWSVAGGTFFGFGYGLYYVSHRPRAALLQVEDGRLNLGLALPTVEPGRMTRVTLVAARF